MKKLLYVLIAFTTLSACKKDDKNPEPTLQGNWELTNITQYNNNGEEVYSDNYPDESYRIFISFENNEKTYLFETDEDYKWGSEDTYTATNDKITFAEENFFDNANTTYSLGQTTLTITFVYSDYKVVYTYKKSDFDVKKAYTEYNLPK